MGKLVNLVARSPSLLLGASVARLPRLRVRASPEAWLITRVRPAKGGGHPMVYGKRFTLGVAATGNDGGGAGVPEVVFEDHDRAIDGPLKGDWSIVFQAGATASARSPDSIVLHPDLLEKVQQRAPPFDGLGLAVLKRSQQERAFAMQRQAAAEVAAAAAAAAASPTPAAASPAPATGASKG
jgi:hypothetical protein